MNRLQSFLHRCLNRETVTYGIFGVATTLVNLLVYRLLLAAAVDYKISNLIAMLASKLFAYIVNKKFVFQSKTDGFGALVKEFLRFAATRGATALVDYFGLILLVECVGMNNRIAKYLITAIVIVLNYFLGKKLVFTAGPGKTDQPGDPLPPASPSAGAPGQEAETHVE